MRKREIHSVAHWAMMFILLMFPLLMVGISGFNKGQEQQTDIVERTVSIASTGNLIEGQMYDFALDLSIGNESVDSVVYKYSEISIDWTDYGAPSGYDYNGFSLWITSGRSEYYVYLRVDNNVVYTFWNGVTAIGADFNFALIPSTEIIQNGNQPFRISTNVFKTEYFDYRSDVNKWIDNFINLPINSWYLSLMNVIGVGLTNSTVMNVIYVMPVYILWVFIFDVIVDCFLVIIKLPHKLLNRLSGGENE